LPASDNQQGDVLLLIDPSSEMKLRRPFGLDLEYPKTYKTQVSGKSY
jgi:hypothetical protein